MPLPKSPIFVSATVDIDPASSGPPNNDALKNPTDGPIEIHEIRFQVGMVPTSSGDFAGGNFSNSICGGLIGADLSIGNLPITNGTTPIWSFGRKRNPWADYVLINTTPPGSGKQYLNFSWRLKHPLYVPKGKGLITSFQNFGSGPAVTTISVRVSYSARQCEPRKGEVLIPWAGPWRSKGIDVASAGTDKSSEINLKPPVSRPYTVERFTGRTLINPNASFFCLVGSLLYSVRLFDSMGRALIRDATIFDLAFPQVSSSWELGELKMPADSYFTAYLSKLAATDGTGNVTSTNIAAVGYYKANVKEI